MSPNLPVVSGREVVRALEAVGFERVSQKGSHVKLRHPNDPADRRRIVIVPLHNPLAPGTLRSILRQADLTILEFQNLLRMR